jgi:nucleotide-binding universal stress UspA family protein
MAAPDWRVLVPAEILEGETVPESVLDVLAPLPVVLLGYHVLPEQTPPGQARLQFEDQAQDALDDLAEALDEAGGEAETRLVFTHDAEQSIDRVADETGCGAILQPNPTGDVERVLVPLRGDVDVERIAAFAAALVADRDIGLTLHHVAGSEAAIPDGAALIDRADAVLREAGVPDTAIAHEVVVDDAPVLTIADAATDHDLVVMGERAPSLRTFLFGEDAERIADRSLGPVVVVRRARDAEPTRESDS